MDAHLAIILQLTLVLENLPIGDIPEGTEEVRWVLNQFIGDTDGVRIGEHIAETDISFEFLLSHVL